MIHQAIKFWNETFSVNEIIRDHDHKKLAKLTNMNGNIFYLKGERLNRSEVERVCQFANELSDILPTPTYIHTSEQMYTADLEGFIFTLETALIEGKEIQQLNDIHIQSIAENFAKQHKHCLQHNILLNKPTSWAMFGGNQTDELGDYDENELSFLDFKQAFSEYGQFAEIEQRYLDYRKQLKVLWSKLPTAATQGDFCYYNMWFKDGKVVGLCDFNLAGDEVYINECIAVGIYLCWHAPYEGKLSGEERFELFMRTYESVRRLTTIELQAKLLLFRVIRAFRFDRVEEGIANKNGYQQFLEETKKLLIN